MPKVDFGAVARPRVGHPQQGFGDCAGLVGFEIGGGARLPPALVAEIVGSALQLGEAQLFADFGRDFRERRLQHRQIFADELLLQVDGVRGYDNALAVLDGVYRGGEQIGERFPNACAGFDDEARAGVDGFGDGLRHLYLLRALFEAGNGRGERAAGGQRIRHGADVYRVGCFGCADCGRLREASGELAPAD